MFTPPENAPVFHDETTPLDDLIEGLVSQPLLLEGDETRRFVGKQALFSLWKDAQGYTVLGVDIHSFVRDEGLPDTDIVVRIPQSVDGVPVVRISSDAFRPWLSYGVRVRLLALPEGFQTLASESLAALCVEHVCLPASMRDVGVQRFDIGRLAKEPREICFHTPHVRGDSRYRACDGSLFEYREPDGKPCAKTLVHQAYPYKRRIRISEDAVYVREAAFVRGGLVPDVIECPDSLQRTDDTLAPFDASKTADRTKATNRANITDNVQKAAHASARDPFSTDPEPLWLCNQNGLLASQLRGMGALCAGLGTRETEGAFFEPLLDPATSAPRAWRLVKSPKELRSFSIPASLDGLPVESVADRGLPVAIETLFVPASIRVIGDDCPGVGLKKLVIDDGVETIGQRCFCACSSDLAVFIPRSVSAIGQGSFAGCAVYLEALGLKAHIPSDALVRLFAETPRELRVCSNERSKNCAPQSPLIRLDVYDDVLKRGALAARREALLDRLEGAAPLDGDTAASFALILRADGEAALRDIAARGSMTLLERLLEANFYEKASAERQCELFRIARRSECLAVLMRWKDARFASAKSAASRFAL